MTEKEKMLRGELYNALDAELVAERRQAELLLRRFRAGEEQGVLRDLLGGIGEGTVVREPFFCDYGYNIRLGAGVFLNFGCVLLDVCPITIGDRCQIGPGVQIYAADHPRETEVRRRGLELGRPVTIGEDVWIGGGAIVLPGVTVGDGAVIGCGKCGDERCRSGEYGDGKPGSFEGSGAMTAQEVKDILGLVPHPREGGWYVRTYESGEPVQAEAFAGGRYAGPRLTGTAIYYLLERGTFSEMHRLKSDEVFHAYLGDAVEQLQLPEGGAGERVVIGRDLAGGERPQVVVRRGVWQGARLVEGGTWALLGCTVSPGFEFEDYEAGERTDLVKRWPEWSEMIRGLTRG